jgi:ribosomal protein L29
MSTTEKLRKKSVADLTKDVEKLRNKINEITRERFTADGKDYSNIAKHRKQLARMLTIITEKENEARTANAKETN